MIVERSLYIKVFCNYTDFKAVKQALDKHAQIVVPKFVENPYSKFYENGTYDILCVVSMDRHEKFIEELNKIEELVFVTYGVSTFSFS